MRLPNGFGTVKKLKGKRRKPYAAIVTVGRNPENGKQIRKYLDYYQTKKEALQALSEYHNNPYNVNASKITFSKFYKEKWYDYFMDGKSHETERTYATAYKDCANIHLYKLAEIKQQHLQEILDSSLKGRASIERIKTLLIKVFDYAVECRYINNNPAKDLILPGIKEGDNYKKRPRKAFTTAEINQLWKYYDGCVGTVPDDIKIALILIYSGVRINELLNLRKEDCNLEKQYFVVRESKTDAGRNRVVPIPDAMIIFWDYFYKGSKCPFVFHNLGGNQLIYDNFKRNYWDVMKKRENLDHTTHETRHTFISLMTKANINPTIIKKIVGHTYNQSLTESVYTHFEVSDLLDAVNKICALRVP